MTNVYGDLAFVLSVVVRHRLMSCWPNEVLVRSGERRRGMGVVRGAGVWDGILILEVGGFGDVE